MIIDQDEFNHNVSELKKFPEINYLIDILETRLEENRDLLEDPVNTEVSSHLVRGSILQIRELIELLE